MLSKTGFQEFSPEELFIMLGPEFKHFVLSNSAHFPSYTIHEKLWTIRSMARFYFAGRLALLDSGSLVSHTH